MNDEDPKQLELFLEEEKKEEAEVSPKFTPEELENSKRIFKSATPKYDLSWYVKWASSILILIALTIRAADYPRIYDMWFGFVGMIGWTYVGILWKDRAIIIMNVISTILLAIGLLTHYRGLF
jgi:hypothetical protein|tara:strand:- start:3152 stop:3520 length:369 start_codon:yes stop_codon:yes gene_type:complete